MRWTTALVVASVLLASCGGSGESSDSDGLTKVTFRLDWVASGYHAPFHLALERGYYAEEGLDVEILDGRGTTQTLQLIGTGADDFGLAGSSGMITAYDKGVPALAVAGYIQRMPEGVISLAEKGIEKPSDLEGLTRAALPGGSTEAIWPAFVEAAGIDDSKIRTINIAREGRNPAILEGQVDFMIGWAFSEATVLERSAGVEVSTLLFSDYGVTMLGHNIIVNQFRHETDPELTCRFVRASMRGVEDALADPEAALDALKKHRPDADRDVLLAEFKRMLEMDLLQTERSKGRPLGWMSPDDWQASIDNVGKYLQELGSENIDPSRLFSNECFE